MLDKKLEKTEKNKFRSVDARVERGMTCLDPATDRKTENAAKFEPLKDV